MNISSPHLHVAVDVGNHEHYVVIGLSSGGILDEFSITHTPAGFQAMTGMSPFPGYSTVY